MLIVLYYWGLKNQYVTKTFYIFELHYIFWLLNHISCDHLKISMPKISFLSKAISKKKKEKQNKTKKTKQTKKHTTIQFKVPALLRSFVGSHPKRNRTFKE